MCRANIMSVLKNIMHARYVENQTIFLTDGLYFTNVNVFKRGL